MGPVRVFRQVIFYFVVFPSGYKKIERFLFVVWRQTSETSFSRFPDFVFTFTDFGFTFSARGVGRNGGERGRGRFEVLTEYTNVYMTWFFFEPEERPSPSFGF